jgi:hypothetical protein
MTYRLNKTNGDLLVDLVDGQVDATTTDITLVGRNYKGFGEFLNENYIKMLEHFASTSAPNNPLAGQLWWDTSEERMKVYDGSTFKAAGGPIVSNQQPQMVAGDLWIDNENNKLYFFDGTDLVLVGPDYDAGQGKTGFEVVSVVDSTSVDRTILKLFIQGALAGIFTNATFYVPPDTVAGYPIDANDTATPKRQLFNKGFNPVDFDAFNFNGVATSARALVDEAGNEKTAANFIPSDENGFTSGSLRVKNSAGLSVGVGDTEYIILKVVGDTSVLESQLSGKDIQFKIRQGNQFKSGIHIDGTDAKIGLWNTNPTVELDVTGDGRFTGDVEIEGNLTVQGDTTQINVATLQVEDRNIELGISEGAAAGGDALVDNGGIILRSTDGDKKITWTNSTDCWTSNQDFDLLTGLEYKINDSLVLNTTTLGSTVVNSSLTNVGVLTEVTIDDITIDGHTITRINGTGINITAGGDIVVDSQKINGVADPDRGTRDANYAWSGGDTDNHVATKGYVDDVLKAEPIVMALDITGLTTPTAINPYTDVAAILNTLYPAASKAGARAKIHCTNYTNVTVSGIDVASAMSKSYISVDKDGSLSSESVVQDVNFSAASGTATLNPVRSVMEFAVVTGAWTWQSTT